MVQRGERSGADERWIHYKPWFILVSGLALTGALLVGNYESDSEQHVSAVPQAVIHTGQTSVTVGCMQYLETPDDVDMFAFGGTAWNTVNDPDQPLTAVISFGCRNGDSVVTPRFVQQEPSEEDQPFDNITRFNVSYEHEDGQEVAVALGHVEKIYQDGHVAVLGELTIIGLANSGVEITPAPAFTPSPR